MLRAVFQAGSDTGDRVWRMPLFSHYTKQVTESQLADINNIGKHARSGGSCTAAAFLKVSYFILLRVVAKFLYFKPCMGLYLGLDLKNEKKNLLELSLVG